MKTLLKLAWRNVWRNKRRTLITIASILFMVLFASFLEAFQKGGWNNMISNVVNYYYGYAQIHHKGYWEDRNIDMAFPMTDSLMSLADDIPEVKSVLPRIESFALASTGNATTGAMVVGIQPEVETKMTGLKDRVIEGAYLKKGEQAVLIAEGLAEKLKLAVNDTLVMISQGYHGVNAAGKYPIKGIARFGSPDLNKQMVYLPLEEAQWFYGAQGLVTSLALQIEDQDDIPGALKGIRTSIDMHRYEVMDWKEMLPELLEAKALDSAGNYIVYFILYIIISFGIFGTILMMTKEREYEFGVLIAIGMKRLTLSATVWLEVIIMGAIGALAGMLAAVPLIHYFKVNPIRFSGEYAGAMEQFGFEPVFPTDTDPQHFLMQGLIVLIITTILALYPFFKIRRLKPVEAMRA